MYAHEIDPIMWKYVPKKYRPVISGLWRDSDGIWMMLKDGWENGDGGQTFHEGTFKEVLIRLRHDMRKVRAA